MLDVATPPVTPRQGPLERAVAAATGPTLEVVPALDRVSLRTSAPDGVPLAFLHLPRAVGAVAEREGRTALCLGPDEWLLLCPPGDTASADLCRTDGPWSAVAVGHRQAGLRVAGPGAALLLNAGCPLDLHPVAFPTGACARTVLAKAEIVLWRRAPADFHLDVARSFASYAWQFLQEAALGMPQDRV